MPPDSTLTLYAFVKDFQALLGTLVGFAGVCLTLWFNANQAEKRRADEIKHDRKTTRAALSSELTLIQKSLATWQGVLSELVKTGEVALPRSFEADGASRAYRSALPKIGLLSEHEIQLTVSAYAQYESLSKMSRDMEMQFGPTKPDEAMRLAFRAYQQALDRALEAANAALTSLSASNRP